MQTGGRQDKGPKEEAMQGEKGLSEEEGQLLLKIARVTIERGLGGREEAENSDAAMPPAFNQRRGTFVTLTRDGDLRGCIGHIFPEETTLEGIRTNSINAAFRDPRFPPLTQDEWGRVKLEISILTNPQPIVFGDKDDLMAKLRPGVDGVIVKKGIQQATFLPQVWEQLPDKEDFLGHLCLKAGLPAEAWKKGQVDVSSYQVQAFRE